MRIYDYNLILVIVLFGLCSCGSNTNSVTYYSSDVPQLSVLLFPSGWTTAGTSKESDLGTSEAFSTIFSLTNDAERFVSTYDFMIYDTQRKSSSAYSRYEASAFYDNVQSTISWQPYPLAQPNIIFADEYILQCFDASNYFRCAYWARYGSCIVSFQAPIADKILGFENYESILESAIDSRLSVTQLCF